MEKCITIQSKINDTAEKQPKRRLHRKKNFPKNDYPDWIFDNEQILKHTGGGWYEEIDGVINWEKFCFDMKNAAIMHKQICQRIKTK